MNEYRVNITLYGTVSYEDPKCPLNWRGSGVYIIEEEVTTTGEVTVSAESEERARELVENYHFNPDDFDLDSVEIDEVTLLGPDEEEGGEEITNVYISELSYRDDYREPDSDDYFEEMLLRDNS